MKATKTESGKWRARAYNKFTKQTKSFTADTKREAERQAQLYELTIKEEKARGMTLDEAIDFYIERRKNVWTSSRTARDYIGYKKHYGELLNAPLCSLDKNVVQKWVNDFAVGRSAKTTKNVLSLLLSARRCVLGDKLEIVRPKVTKPILKLPSESDVVSLMAMAEETESRYNLTSSIYLSSLACMRRGEIAALSMSDLDFNEHTICIRYSLTQNDNGEWVKKPPKNMHQRKITAPGVVFDKIKQYGLPDMDPDKITDRFIKLRKKCAVECRFHDLRHFCAARMLSITPNPIPISVVQEYGGWEDQKVLLNIYNYVIAESRNESLQNWDKYSEQLANNLPQTPDGNKKSP